MPECFGSDTDHCCYLGGIPCQFVEENADGRRWSCALRRELGSWEAVHKDLRYLAAVRPALDKMQPADGKPMVDCGDWPPPGVKCHECGVTG